MDCIQTKGKLNKKVTTLLLPEMVRAIDAMLDLREQCGILKDNKFLFPNSAMGCQPSWALLTSLAEAAGCENPMSVTSTRLRKYLATVCQVSLPFVSIFFLLHFSDLLYFHVLIIFISFLGHGLVRGRAEAPV